MPLVRNEVHYGRVVPCFATRPAHVDAMFRDAVARRPDGIALVWEAIRLSYRALDERVDGVARNLSARGLGAGDRIALLVGNRPEFLVIVLAAARLGAIVVPMNIRQKRPEILHALAHSGAKMLVFEGAYAAELPDPDSLPALRNRIVVGDANVAGALAFQDLLSPTAHPLGGTVGEESPFCILYTSGTTGTPKGAILTHLGIVHSVLHYRHAFGLRDGEVAALVVPASHVTGLVAILLAMIGVAGTTVIAGEFKASRFLALMARERVTYTLIVPAMYSLCLQAPDLPSHDLSAWRVGGYGGAPMPGATITRLAEALPGLGLVNIYGATETTSPVTVLDPAHAVSHADTVGRPLPCARVLVLDEDGREVAAGERGELMIAGPMTIPGYWDGDAANEASFVGGYWKSGDVGSVDADGYVRIHDRMKDVVNRGGYKIYSIEVENVLAQYPCVVECAVLGYPDSVLGERVAAFVRLQSGDVEAEQIRQFCAARLSDYKIPEAIVLVEEPLPRNANGKVLKAALKTRLLDAGVALR